MVTVLFLLLIIGLVALAIALTAAFARDGAGRD